ncbi:MAG TPA: Rnf-Nqr domain containing protein [Porticoccaceae bacterium]|nr:Rnf-Nqr domain containing protein [Porticoccaceae bacterium]
MQEIALILVATALVNNILLTQLLGISSLLDLSARSGGALHLAAATATLILVATLGHYPMTHWLLEPLQLQSLALPAAVLWIGLAAALSELASRRLDARLHLALVRMRPLTIANGAVLGTALLNAERASSLAAALANAVGVAFGFALVLVLLAGVRERLEAIAVPEAFRGAPIILLSAGLMALAFLGFARMA